MDRKVVQVVFLEWLQSLQWSPHSQLLEVVWCSAVAVVVVVVVVVVVIVVVVVVSCSGVDVDEVVML